MYTHYTHINTLLVILYKAMNSSCRSRSWCFTLNNYTIDNINTLTHPDFILIVNKFCFQEEIGKNENKHLQGVINFKSARHFETMKKLLPKAHWEQCRNLKRSLMYCSKEETRNGKIYTHNYQPESSEKTPSSEEIYKYLLAAALKDLKENPVNSNILKCPGDGPW